MLESRNYRVLLYILTVFSVIFKSYHLLTISILETTLAEGISEDSLSSCVAIIYFYAKIAWQIWRQHWKTLKPVKKTSKCIQLYLIICF